MKFYLSFVVKRSKDENVRIDVAEAHFTEESAMYSHSKFYGSLLLEV